MSQIIVEGVKHTYRPPRGRPVLALDDVSLDGAHARIPRAAWPIGLRQVDAALSDRRLPADRGRPHPGRRQAGRRTGTRPRHRVPAFRAVSLEDRARQHPLRARAAGHAARRARGARAGLHRSRRPQGFRGQLSVAALRRHEAAHRDRAHARLRSGDPAHGRAVRRARRADPQPDAGGAARHLAAHAQDRDLRHPRRARGGVSRRPRRRDVGAARAHQGDRRDAASTRTIRDLFKTKAFVDKVDEIWNLVRDEAIKAQETRAP